MLNPRKQNALAGVVSGSGLGERGRLAGYFFPEVFAGGCAFLVTPWKRF